MPFLVASLGQGRSSSRLHRITLNNMGQVPEQIKLCALLQAFLGASVEDFNAIGCGWLSNPEDNEVFELRFLSRLRKAFDGGYDQTGLFPSIVTASYLVDRHFFDWKQGLKYKLFRR